MGRKIKKRNLTDIGIRNLYRFSQNTVIKNRFEELSVNSFLVFVERPTSECCTFRYSSTNSIGCKDFHLKKHNMLISFFIN